jgi:uncharacterized membrane protein
VTSGTRDPGVDVARGVALISMFVAHVAPGDGPGNLLELSEYLTAPLFATLIGMGLWLGWTRLEARSVAVNGRFVAGVAVRAVALIGTGLLLERLSTDVVFVQVIIVLVHLGVLMIVAAPLVRLPSSVVAAVGVLAVVLGSVLESVLSPQPILYSGYAEGHLGTLSPARALDIVAYGPYRLTYLLAFACLGIVLARRSQLTSGLPGSRLRRGQEDRTTWQLIRGDTLVTIAALGLCGAGLLARAAGAFTMVAYQRNVPEVVFDALLCTAAVCGSAVVVRLLPRPALRPLALAGAMTLTLYVAQVLVLAAFTARHDAATWSDDSWPMLIGLIAGSLAFAVVWHAVVRTGAFARGPLEGVVGLGVRAVQKPLARPRSRETAV